jgi:hypothetical protein
MKAWTTGCKSATVDGLELRTNKIVFILLMMNSTNSYFVWASELLACCLICISKFS